MWTYFKTLLQPRSISRRTPLSVAITQIGVEEQPRGSNWGEPVQDYLLSVGIKFQASWCMAFVYWCCRESGSYNALVKTGGVLQQWNKVGSQYKFYQPKVGDIFIMDFGKGLGHCGFVEQVKEKTILTVEGNTNDTGAREGFEVCRRERPILKCKGFIRI